MAVNFERDRRVAVTHVFADGLNRNVLGQEQAAIGVAQAVASDMFRSPFPFVKIQVLSDRMRKNRIAVQTDGDIVVIQAIVKITVRSSEPLHKLL